MLREINQEEYGFQFCGIKFAPIWIPLRRRMQTLALFHHMMTGFFIGMFILPFVMSYMLLCTSYWYLVILYICWYIYDRNTPQEGGRKWSPIRNGTYYIALRDYFPAKLIKTAELPITSNYLLCAYPHGVICHGVMVNFGTNVNLKEVFPKLDVYILALSSVFNLPLTRELFLASGVCSSTEKSIHNLLAGEATGKAAVLMVGGASESLLTKPGSNHIILSKRKEFVRLALKLGVALVPVYSFGENDIYNQIRSEWLEKIQNKIRKHIGIVPLVVLGRGIFQYSFGILPHRNPITTVVGKPIPVTKIENPTNEQVDTLHAKYRQELQDLFDKHKEKYDRQGSKAQLIIE